MTRYQFIEQVAGTEPVRCRVLHMSPAGYYQWRSRAARLMPSWESAATAVFSRHAQRYGPRRLRAEGYAVGRYALRTWLRRRGLHALSTRPQRPCTTVADPAAVVAENLLLGQPAPTAPKSGLDGRHYVPAPGRRALVLPSHLARYLLAARGRLATR